ncbi:MAG: site-specific DNA-methyltransferase (adenine-specific) [Enterobacterales bacterium]|jgi:site-specific DNA-methyltransferase (adenine-specific)
MSIELLNIDCMDYMAGLEDNAFDLAIVDPPYGINEGKNNESRNRVASNKHKSKEWDSSPPEAIYFTELQRISKNQIVWGANHFIHKFAIGSPCWLVWDKDNGGCDFADCELAYTSFKTAVRKFKFQWAGMLQGDMKNKEHRIHPTQKPVKLYDWLLKNYAKEGDKILDTHLGSGSSAIAAHYGGFDFVGCELDEDYYNETMKRFDNETRQIDLLGEL